MDSKTEPASEAKERIEKEAVRYQVVNNIYRVGGYHGYIAGATAERNRAQEEITRLKAELEKAKDELQLAKFDYKAMFDEVKRLRSLLSEFEKMKAELERERELRKELVDCLEVHQTKWISAEHYWGSDTNEWAESLIKKSKKEVIKEINHIKTD